MGRRSHEPPRSLRADQRWAPSPADLSRGRAAVAEAFARAENVPVAEYAKAAGQTPQQVEADISARRLLALEGGQYGRRIPAWQLHPLVLGLTRTVLQKAADIDAWTIYQVLTNGMDLLDGKAPIDAVKLRSANEVAAPVLERLGVY